MSDWMGQRITPAQDDPDYCRRHRALVDPDAGCERCKHESQAEDDDDYRRELSREQEG